ncbi:flavin-containing monooxygenase [Pseudomonas chlororaphis]|uniref:flavin-containing monooxygenase n=3 Tax=Pseudomonas chlororaphis TaxID=587753 RepID=UPI001B32A877|nr:NAD(P)/FAD-dependent oxidoreductase [Pseudomonas chlororaphis]MBP5143128.1 NAD(P)/FAD-dependent oxidoreductase [Pseudomonas chlororaphis]
MSEHVDVLIIGAGISGIGAAYRLQQQCPGRSFLVLDAMDGFGGTWRTHRYPGARSDSDLFTYGYSFKPWRGASIASAEEIRNYLGEVIEENGLGRHIRYGHQVVTANWSTQDGCWTVEVIRLDTGKTLQLTANFLWQCQGYYRHQHGHVPDWSGLESFQGVVVHPQSWPEDLDWKGKRIIVIGSGATAATLIPALTEKAEHVTLLQRSPTFFVVEPAEHALAAPLRALDIPEEWTYEILRKAYIAQNLELNRMSLEQPEDLRKQLLDAIRAHLPDDFDVEKHFSPRYRPQQQRLAFVPGGDFFVPVRDGKASIVTDTIECFSEKGITLSSGEFLEADIVVTATGFNLCLFGDVLFSVDGTPVDFTGHVTYRGLMINDVPNMAYTLGYLRTSWTMRVDMVSEFVCRLLGYMQERGAKTVVPVLRPQEASMPHLPFCDPNNFHPGYIMRSQNIMYRQGDRAPWQSLREYAQERPSCPRQRWMTAY